MGECDLGEKRLLEKLRALVEKNPGKNDVTFCVGPQKKQIGAVRIILEAASSSFDALFLQDKWQMVVMKVKEGIQLPEYDPDAFELFIKLLTLDTWSAKALANLNLSTHTILSLLSICRRFQIQPAIRNLEEIATPFMQSFSNYKNSQDFLQLSQVNLETILASDELGMRELDVFACAINWAKAKCDKINQEPSHENLRRVLGHCLFQIRFPVMAVNEFAKAMQLNSILTVEETLAIYKHVALETTKESTEESAKLPFKTTKRRAQLKAPFIGSVLMVPWSTLDLTKEFRVADSLAYVCDGTKKLYNFQSNGNIALHGLGFLGPIGPDSFYDVTISIVNYGSGSNLLAVKKQIWAQTGKIFHFVFDAPLTLQPNDLKEWGNHYNFFYFLKGPKTSAVQRKNWAESSIQENGTQFKIQWQSSQLAEILYRSL